MNPESITMTVQLNYNQVLGLAMQLNDQDKFNLSRALATTSRALRLKELCTMFRTDEISEADILQECETVRQQIYDDRTK